MNTTSNKDYIVFGKNFKQIGDKNWGNYYQDDYDVIIDRVEIIRYNPSVVKDPKVEWLLHNSTQGVFNGSVYLLMDLISLEVQLYKRVGNEYVFTTLGISADVCSQYHLNVFKAQERVKLFTNVVKCPPDKGYYYVRNYTPDMSKGPPYFPRGDYKVVGKITVNKGMFGGEVHGYGSIKDKASKKI